MTVMRRTRFTQFFGNCTDCHFDFLCFHAYECTVGGLNYWVGQMQTFGLPIWLTEFACPSDSGSVTIDDEVAYMQNALWSLDNNTQIERYHTAHRTRRTQHARHQHTHDADASGGM